MKSGLFVLCLGASVILVGALPLDTTNQNEASTNDSRQPLVRERRTIGILRDIFPNFSQYVDRKIQMLTRIIFRIVGRLVLQGNRNGGDAGGGGGGGDDSRISITLPTYAPDLTEESEDEDSTGASTVDSDVTPSSGGEATTTLNPNGDAENAVAESQVKEVRVKREAASDTAAVMNDSVTSVKQADEADNEEETVADDGKEDLDQEGTDDNEVSEDNDAESSEVEQDDDDPRNKRFLNFNLGGGASADAGSSGGGSGNFLFDIIRLVAGSGSGSGQSSSSSSDSSSSGGDASASAGVETGTATSEGKDDNNAYGVGVPGPLTRLFVVANRGVASLIQDLILRLAQTSERLVNFKARLITSII